MLELIDVGAGCCDAFYCLGTIMDGLHEFVSWGDGGLVIVLCWNATVSLNCSLLVDLMWHLWVQ